MVVLPASVHQFETNYRARALKNRITSFVTLILLSCLVYWAFSIAGILTAFGDGKTLSNIADFLARMNPNLQANHLFDDRATSGSIAHWYARWPIWRKLMIETIEIAYVSLVLSTCLGLFSALLAASTTNPIMPIRWFVRRILETIRTVPDLILAIFLVTLFGLGPLAGIITLTLSGTGTLGRFFGEALENIDERPREAMQSAGAGHWQQVRFGVVPQIIPLFVSFIFLRLETSLASATTLGLVGAGGIGTELIRAMEFNQYQSYFAILLLILVLIVIADLLSEFVRHRMALTEAVL